MSQVSSKPLINDPPLVPPGELIEERALRAYRRRFGNDAEQPSTYLTVVETDLDDGMNYVHLANGNGRLATYRISRRSFGWRLTYMDQVHSRS